MQKQIIQSSNTTTTSWRAHLSPNLLIKLPLYLFIGWQFAALFWLGDQHLYVDQLQVYGVMEKPFVYRQLVPLLTRVMIWLTGVRVDAGLVAAIALSAAAAIVTIGIFLREFKVEKIDLHELIGASILFIWLVKDAKIYDFATIATFTISLVLLHQRKFWLFQIAYFLACLNRETSYLLTVFFAYHFFRKLETRIYIRHLLIQLAIFFLVRITMLIAYQNNPGVIAQFNFFWIMEEFSGSLIGTLAIIGVFVGVTWLVVRRWQVAPAFLKDIVLTFTPFLFIMWLLFGRAFELRVFFEMFPALYVIAFGRVESPPQQS